VRSVRDNR